MEQAFYALVGGGKGRLQTTPEKCMHHIWLTSVTVFISGALLLTLELFVAKAMLPMVGGSALAWTTCVAFFQTLLFAGSLYAHLTARIGIRRQVILHAGVLVAAFAMLPLRINAPAAPFHNEMALYMFQVLSTSFGLPCFVLCTTTSLVMQWLSRAPAQLPARAYAAGNAGSLSALVAYPFLIEPLLGLSAQSKAWTAVFAVFAVAMLWLMTSAAGTGEGQQTEIRPIIPPMRGSGRKWFVLSFVPCCLLLGVTSHMTNELPSFPLLWVVPLTLYLASLVIAFGTKPDRWLSSCLAIEPVLIAVMVVIMFVPVKTSGFLVHLAAVFVASLTLHGQLALLDPEADRGAFMLWSCAGGATAGIFNAVIAPVIFPFVLEFQLAVVAACLLRPMAPVRRHNQRAPTLDFILPLVLAVCLVAVLASMPQRGEADDIFARIAILFVGAGTAVIFRHRPLRYGLAMAAVLLGGFWAFQMDKTEYAARSSYGVSRVVHDRGGKQMLLFHGTTIHGAQGDAAASSGSPRLYFRPEGPLGRIMQTGAARQEGRSFAVVGLGAGSLAWYLSPSQQMKFYEIDPVVEKIAKDSRWFSYLARARGKTEVTIGDGRLALAAEPDNTFDLIILDAFSSDSAPVHLLTREAFAIYLRKLKPRGLLIFNTSNRHIALSSVVVSVAHTLGLHVRVTLPPGPHAPDRKSATEFGTWAVAAREVEDFSGWLDGDDRWILPGTPAVAAWTDNRTVMLPVLKW